MIVCDALTGMRRSELMGLQWHDFDFFELRINIVRSVVDQVIGNCKTEASRKPVVMDDHIAQALKDGGRRACTRPPPIGSGPHHRRRVGSPSGWRRSCGTTSSRQQDGPGSPKRSAGIPSGIRSRRSSSLWAWMRRLFRNSCGMHLSKQRWMATRRLWKHPNARHKQLWRI